MDSFQYIQLFVAINLAVIGLSHFLQPKIWADFFTFLHSIKNTGNIINALIALTMGSIVMTFHNIWTWPAILITFYGLLQLIKAILYLTIPKIGVKSIGKVTLKNASKFKWAGLIMFLFSGTIFYNLIVIL